MQLPMQSLVFKQVGLTFVRTLRLNSEVKLGCLIKGCVFVRDDSIHVLHVS